MIHFFRDADRDFCTSALLKALKINLVTTLKKADGQAFRIVEVQKSAREFSHDLDQHPEKSVYIYHLDDYGVGDL